MTTIIQKNGLVNKRDLLEYLTEVRLLITHRNEIIDFLGSTESEEVDFLITSINLIQSNMDIIKEVRVKIKNTTLVKMSIDQKETYTEALLFVHSHLITIHKELTAVYKKCIRVYDKICTEIRTKNLPDFITTDLQSIDILIKDIKRIIDLQPRIKKIFNACIVLNGKKK